MPCLELLEALARLDVTIRVVRVLAGTPTGAPMSLDLYQGMIRSRLPTLLAESLSLDKHIWD
jgi:hypothetical protein